MSDLAKRAVTFSRIQAGAVTSSRVRDHSLLAKDFKAAQLPAGLQGAKGDTGARGPAGAANQIPANNFSFATANCHAGERAVGGGWLIDDISAVSIFDTYDGPTPSADGSTPTGWAHGVYNDSGDTGLLRAHALCAAP